MTTDKKISTLVDTQVPEFVIDEGPRFISFLKAYYEFLEQSNNSIDMSKNILSYRDIDKTLDDFIQYFRYEVMQKIPENIKSDKRILAKYIRDVYETKGAENAYKFLFRALYDDEITIYYPRDYILIASDGRWLQENSVRVREPFEGSLENFRGKIVEGENSGTKGRVQRIEEHTENGIQVFELYLENITGSGFSSGEIVATTVGNTKAEIVSTSGVLVNLNITNGGALHQQGDAVNFKSPSGKNANGIVKTTNDQNSIEVDILDGGSGYKNNVSYIVPGGSGSGAEFKITSLSNTELISLNTNIIDPMRNVPLNETPTFTSGGANTSTIQEPLASANVNSILSNSLTFSNSTFGTIQTIGMLSFGSGYNTSIPSDFTPINTRIANLSISDGQGGIKGENAIMSPKRIPGSIIDVTINNKGEDYRVIDLVTIENVSRTEAIDGEGAPIVSGVRNYPGKYTDTKGFLSWDIVLQDSNFYQVYSYVIRSKQSYSKYRQIVKELLHPAGINVFGDYLVETNITNSSSIDLVEFSLE